VIRGSERIARSAGEGCQQRGDQTSHWSEWGGLIVLLRSVMESPMEDGLENLMLQAVFIRLCDFLCRRVLFRWIERLP